MKKTYMIPKVTIVCSRNSLPLCGSVYSQGMDIGYGGIDEDGTVVAGVRRYNAWDGDPLFRDDPWAE